MQSGMEAKSALPQSHIYTVEPLSADTPKIRTSTVLRTVRDVPNEIPLTYVYLTPLKADTSLFRIADMRSSLFNTVTLGYIADSTSYTRYTKCQTG